MPVFDEVTVHCLSGRADGDGDVRVRIDAPEVPCDLYSHRLVTCAPLGYGDGDDIAQMSFGPLLHFVAMSRTVQDRSVMRENLPSQRNDELVLQGVMGFSVEENSIVVVSGFHLNLRQFQMELVPSW